MSGPFIFIATNRLKPGKLDEEKARVPGLVDFIEANEPRLLAFNEYANEEGTEVAVVQIHPDADSMTTHMKVGMEHFATAYAEYLEAESSLQIHGNLTEDLIRAISAAAQTDGDDSNVTIRQPFAGFDRLPAS